MLVVAASSLLVSHQSNKYLVSHPVTTKPKTHKLAHVEPLIIFKLITFHKCEDVTHGIGPKK